MTDRSLASEGRRTGGAGQGRLARALAVVAVGAIVWLLPPPGALSPDAMHLLGIFLATIAGLVLQPLPQGAIVLSGVALAAITGTLSPADALAGYSDSTVWLIVAAFLFARGFILTGLGRRIALVMVRTFGTSVLGLGYALVAADAALAPATPSNTARAGGILFPVVSSLASCLGSRRAGAFLMLTEFHVNLVTSALFLTGVAPNAMMVKLAQEAFGYRITWTGWFLAALLPAAVSLLILPPLLYRLLRPEVARSADAAVMARQELQKMGPPSRAEKLMLAVSGSTLLLWATGQWTNLNATAVALAGLSALIVSGVMRWEEVVAERPAWDALVWFGGLVSLAAGLGKAGAIGLLARTLQSSLGGIEPWPLGFVLVVAAYVYSHYFVASMTAHATALYVPLGLVAVSLGAPVPLTALVLGFMNSLNAAMTTYGTGPAPIYFGAGYVDQGTWWKYGLVVSVVNLAIWLIVGGAWWKALGLW